MTRHGGFVNKFQGDAALAIFGAPIEHPDASGARAGRLPELHDELLTVLGDAEFGIGVSAGRAIAGHIGAQARFEYTVIGDPVNEAARLTELAKLERDTCWRRRSRSAAPSTPRHCAGTSARSSNCAAGRTDPAGPAA